MLQLNTDNDFNISTIAFDKNHQIFNQFWEKYTSQIANDDNRKNILNTQLADYRKQVAHIASQLSNYRHFLEQMPILVAIGNWMRDLKLSNFEISENFFNRMLSLLDQQVIPLIDQNDELVTLKFFMQCGHQDILENIRCIRAWHLLEKEEIVQCYIAFTQQLARQAYGLIPVGFDPDRERARLKVIRYESFIEFIQYLPERDSLIAQFLYFGAPGLEELLSLKKDKVLGDSFAIHFVDGPISFPRHLIFDLRFFIGQKSKDSELVFTNVRGAEVERAHLNQSFARACEKISHPIKITPGVLLRLKNRQD